MMRPPRSRPIPFVVTLIIGGVAATLLVWPQGFGLEHAVVVSQIVAFRGPTAIVLCIGTVLFAVVALVERTWGIAAGLAIVLGLATVAGGAVILTRGTGAVAATADHGDLTVVAWNTLGGAAPPSSVARLVMEEDADIVSLPEMDERTVAAVARALSADGHPMTAHTTRGEAGDSSVPTSVLIADHLGQYVVDAAAGSTPGLPSVVLRPADGEGAVIVAAHTYPPLPSSMDTWRAGLRWVADQCDAPEVIVAGDLNATVDHFSGLGRDRGVIGSCQDAALAAGTAAVGTWPASAPPWLASPIDHVLTGSAWTVRQAHVVTSLDSAGSDHRPIVAVLTRR